jgi:hypothetical protein
MKTIFTIILLFFITSCSVLKGYSIEGFTIQGNVVSYNGTPMAELTALEFGLDNNKIVKEMSFTLLHGSNNEKINNLLAFLHDKHPDYEIELNIPFEHKNGLE